MSHESMPAALRLTEGLGPLPEPYKRVRIVEDADYPIDLHLYAPAQMLAYATAAVAAERERCARLCENLTLANPGRADMTADQCAAAIRGLGA